MIPTTARATKPRVDISANRRWRSGEVAYVVGYSEPAPFHRAFKRWYGVTPDVFR